MSRLRKVLLGLAAIVFLVLVALAATGRSQMLLLPLGLLTGAPNSPFDPTELPRSLDYSDDRYWAALPGSPGYADFLPEGIVRSGSADRHDVDVFFIHPTGLMNGDSWVSNLNPSSKTEQNTLWMMANQASVFNGCCEVFAPRYRQANLFTYIDARGMEIRRIMRFAYRDVLAAFENFIAHRNQGRPFIIASHSQGTHHGIVLLREQIEGTPLAERMIAAYLIGGRLSAAELAGMEDITICDSPTQLHCLVHWDTMSEEAGPDRERAGNICVNPLTWRNNDTEAPSSEHDGAVLPSGRFQIDFFNDEPGEVEFAPLGAPLVNYVSARCGDGVLYVPHLGGTAFSEAIGVRRGTNYHQFDYPLFSIDIRNNAILRSRTYFQRQAEMSSSPR